MRKNPFRPPNAQESPPLNNSHSSRHDPGFALVVTLSLMVLLTIVALGLLSLSAISLRASSQGEAGAVARSNARLSLLMAIGELQKQAGPDMRVTARADILDAGNPPVLGVWKSWEGTNHDDSGLPVSPGNYALEKKNRFLGWLTSAAEERDPGELPDTLKRPGKVTLVGERSVGSGVEFEPLQIHLEPTMIARAGNRGGYAWWVAGENQKARLPQPYEPFADTFAEWTVHAKTHAVADPGVFGLDALLTDPEPAGHAISLKQGDLLEATTSGSNSINFFHDLSTTSVGLLTNTATGGWRKDLSLLTENWSKLPDPFPVFQVKPGLHLESTKPTPGNPTAAGSIFYPWAGYRDGIPPNDFPIYRLGAVTSWRNLTDYATAYQRMTAYASGRTMIEPHSVSIYAEGKKFGYLHKIRVQPVMARIQWVFSHTANDAPAPPADETPPDPPLLQPGLLMTPVITMWNPYNVELTSPPLDFRVRHPLPPAFKYSVNGIPSSRYYCLFRVGSLNPSYRFLSSVKVLRYSIPTGFLLKPGETRVFSPADTAPQVLSNEPIRMAAGYRSGSGHSLIVKGDDGKPMTLPASARIKADVRFDTAYTNVPNGRWLTGVMLDIDIDNSARLAYRMDIITAMANEAYPPITGMAEIPLSEARLKPVPFLSTMLGARIASNTHLATKGFLQSSPLVNYTIMGTRGEGYPNIAHRYGGTYHPINSPYDYSFVEHPTGGDSHLPNVGQGDRGFIVTGFSAAEGLSRVSIAELPTRPLHSLGELQNWDMRYDNPIPPYAINLIGNSSAAPLLPADAVMNPHDGVKGDQNLQYDDSYCANHLLFDDWFFSSIAPDPTHGAARTMEKTYTDFLTGGRPLANRSYRAFAEDAQAATAASAAALYTKHVDGSESYQTIASRLEVEGMFNVNSTSVTAWRALLGHARNQRVPYIRESSSNWNIALSDRSDHAFSRFSIASDVESKEAGSSGPRLDAAEFAGYRVLSESMLDELAAEVVKQVRERGPFLSLAEFVNRQLTGGDRALAGTIQAALDELAKSPPGNNPYEILQGERDTQIPASAEYAHPEAAVGKSSFGLPGWIRQADVLRPLAPVLSARDDTFTIRAYGDARDAQGKILALAVCEAVVRRTRDMIDPEADEADATALPTAPANRLFGRRFQTVSFRWLSPDET